MPDTSQLLPPLIRSLQDPGRYPHPATVVELIETHISWVLLAGDFAYKIKKPVDLGFLDFSSLEKRHFFCTEEVRLNRRLAPDLYLDVVGIGGTPEQPAWEAGDPIEYAVRMRRFPQQAQLDHMLAAGELRASQLDAFARMIAEFHRVAAVAGAGTLFGEEPAVYEPVEDNFQALREALTSPGAVAQLDGLEAWAMARFLALRDLLAVRKSSGFVRECHGDLHLRNLAWVDEQPVAFDCIEFSPALRWIDVLNEVAFLTMDLRARAQPAMAARFLNRYLEHTGDYAGLKLLQFYQVYRALVRAKVDAIRLRQGDLTAAEQVQVETECGRYLELARNFGQLGQPWLLITRGLSGSGKTTLSEDLVERLGAIRIRSDVERKRLFGLAAGQSASAEPGQGIYSADASRQTYASLRELAESVLEAGYPVIVDAVFAEPERRSPFQVLAADQGLPFLILEFSASPATLRERIANRPQGASDADIAVLESQLASWQPLLPEEKARLVLIDTEQPLDPEEFATQIRDALQAG